MAPVIQTAGVYGVTVESDFALPGLLESVPEDVLPRVRVRQVPAAEIDRRVPPGSGERLGEERFSDGRPPDRTVDLLPGAGYRLYARYFGLALVAPDGAEILCAPPTVPAWRWQRLLVGRALPLAALLRGYELLHASAVVVGDDHLVGIVGPSGSGKSTLALHLSLGGATLASDDVVALQMRGGAVWGFPGPGVVSLRDSEDDLARAVAGPDGPAELLGWSGKSHLAAPRADRALPVAALYYLDGEADEPGIEEMPGVDPRLLLASTLMHEIRHPERLRRQLEVCSALALGARHFRLVRSRGRPQVTADAVASHAAGTPG